MAEGAEFNEAVPAGLSRTGLMDIVTDKDRLRQLREDYFGKLNAKKEANKQVHTEARPNKEIRQGKIMPALSQGRYF